MLAKITLIDVNSMAVCVASETYKVPNKKIPMMESRSLRDAWMRHTRLTGRVRIAISVAIFGTALPINDPLRLIQCPGMDLSHVRATGVHWKTQAKMMENAHEMVTKSRIYAPMRVARSM